MNHDRWQAYGEYVEQIMQREHIAGVAVAVAQHGEIVYSQGFGLRNVETGDPVTSETIFGIASVSKSFTAMAIMQLQEAGLLSVDDPVIKYLPEFILPGVQDMSEIKIYHLLSHTTGLPPMRRRQDIQTFDEHIEFLKGEEFRLLGDTGKYLSYCNDTFLMLGAIIERLTGRNYRKYMDEHLLYALEMYRSTYSIEELTRFRNVTVPYMWKDEKWQEQAWPALGNFEVGGGVRSSVTDLLHYGQVYVNGGVYNGKQIISEESIQRMRTPLAQIDRNTWYGFALSITPNHGGVTLVEHGGSQPGVAANFGFVPEQGIVVAVLTNTSGVSAKTIWLGAANTALGLPVDMPRSEEPEYEMPEHEVQNIVGTYKSNEGGKITVLSREGNLFVETEGEQFPARASGRDSIVFEAKSQRVVKFHLDEQGKAWAAFVGLRMLQRAE